MKTERHTHITHQFSVTDTKEGFIHRLVSVVLELLEMDAELLPGERERKLSDSVMRTIDHTERNMG